MKKVAMKEVQVRKSNDRGYVNLGWLKSYHSFSFGEYFDRHHMHFSVLRVINDDIVAAGMGFGMHPHRDMEIVTYVLSGEIKHHDSIGNGSVIKAGDVQRMTAGTGVLHSEFNASQAHEAHLLQVWLLPESDNLPPSYEERHFSDEQKLNQWCLIATRNPEGNALDGAALRVHQDMQLYATLLNPNAMLHYALDTQRSAYLHVASGEVKVNGLLIMTGDALMLSGENSIVVESLSRTELLLFDLPLHTELREAHH